MYIHDSIHVPTYPGSFNIAALNQAAEFHQSRLGTPQRQWLCKANRACPVVAVATTNHGKNSLVIGGCGCWIII